MADKEGALQYSLTLVRTEGGSDDMVLMYGTKEHEVVIKGRVYPKDLTLAHMIVQMVKKYHRHGPPEADS